MEEKKKIVFDVFGEYEDFCFEHRDVGSKHTVIWSESSKVPMSVSIFGHLTDSQVRCVLEAYREAFYSGKRFQARAVQKMMRDLIDGGPK